MRIPRDVETASRLHRNVCNILGAAIDLYQLSDRSLRSEFSSADLDGDRVLDEAIYELDSEGNLEPFGKSQWGEDVASQEKYAVLLACSSAALGALQLKQQDPVAAIGVLRPAVSFLKGRLQRQGISLGESWARIQPLRNPPNGTANPSSSFRTTARRSGSSILTGQNYTICKQRFAACPMDSLCSSNGSWLLELRNRHVLRALCLVAPRSARRCRHR